MHRLLLATDAVHSHAVSDPGRHNGTLSGATGQKNETNDNVSRSSARDPNSPDTTVEAHRSTIVFIEGVGALLRVDVQPRCGEP